MRTDYGPFPRTRVPATRCPTWVKGERALRASQAHRRDEIHAEMVARRQDRETLSALRSMVRDAETAEIINAASRPEGFNDAIARIYAECGRTSKGASVRRETGYSVWQ